jgi:hypothetical protein
LFKDVPTTLPIAPYGIIVLLGKTNTGPSGKCPYCPYIFVWYATVPVEGREKVRRDKA